MTKEEDNWSLIGNGMTCGGDIPLPIIGLHTIYTEEVIETLRKRLIEDVTDELYHSVFFDYGYPAAMEKAAEVVNKRFGVTE